MSAQYRVPDSHLIDPPDAGDEPSADHYATALANLSRDAYLLAAFREEQPDAPMSAFADWIDGDVLTGEAQRVMEAEAEAARRDAAEAAAYGRDYDAGY